MAFLACAQANLADLLFFADGQRADGGQLVQCRTGGRCGAAGFTQGQGHLTERVEYRTLALGHFASEAGDTNDGDLPFGSGPLAHRCRDRTGQELAQRAAVIARPPLDQAQQMRGHAYVITTSEHRAQLHPRRWRPALDREHEAAQTLGTEGDFGAVADSEIGQRIRHQIGVGIAPRAIDGNVSKQRQVVRHAREVRYETSETRALPGGPD